MAGPPWRRLVYRPLLRRKRNGAPCAQASSHCAGTWKRAAAAARPSRRSSGQFTGCFATFMSSTNTSEVLASFAVMPISRRS